MFTKIIGKIVLCFIMFTTFIYTSCINENLDKQFELENKDGIFELPVEIKLPFNDTVQAKSAATVAELNIYDAYILFFNSSNKYVTGAKIDVAKDIVGKGTTTPKIKLPFKESLSGVKKAVILFNTGYTSTTIPLTTSDTINGISAKFPSTKWGINTTTKGLPMSGTATVSNGVVGTCTVKRAIAKVSVNTASLDKTISGSIGNSPYSIALNSFTWKLCNYTERGKIYDDASTVTYSFINSGYMAVDTVGRYIGAYSNSTKAKTTTVTNTVFNKERTCVILKANVTENGTTKNCYYRLDFFNAGKYIDINRNTNYTFNVKSIKSRGYSSEKEALANPGGNVDYTLAEGSDSQSVNFSNGQYIVLADKHIVYVDDSYTGSTAKNLMSVRFLSNGSSNPNFNKNISTRTVEIVGSDKKTRVLTSILQLCNSAGTAASGNILTLEVDDGVSAAYMLKVKTNQTTLSKINNGTIYYIKISYGNIVGYIPIGVVFFDVKINSTDGVSSEGTKPDPRTITVTSRKYCPASIYDTVNIAEPWTLSNSRPYQTGNINLYTSEILTGVEAKGTGNSSFNVELPKNEYSPPKLTLIDTLLSAGTKALRAKAAVSNIDLSVQNAKEISNQNTTIKYGGRYTANCYLVNAPGTYCFPLVMGNGIKNGAINTSAYEGPAIKPGDKKDCVLKNFVDYKGRAISSPYIKDASRAELLWTDWPNLIKDVRIENRNGNDYVCFTVPKEEICEGNAVICIKDANGTIMWSWHIWVTNYELGDGVSQLKGYWGHNHYVMPYELGFVDRYVFTPGEIKRGTYLTFEQTSTSTQRTICIRQKHGTYYKNRTALYYSFGRKDPYAARYNKLLGQKFQKIRTRQSISYFIQQPLKVTDSISIREGECWYTETTNNYPVINENAGYINLWDNNATHYDSESAPSEVSYRKVIKTIYDPSPVGFTVANRHTFSGLVTNSRLEAIGEDSDSNTVYTWGTVYSLVNKDAAVSKGVNVVTDFTRGTFWSKIGTPDQSTNFVMEDNSRTRITFHLDLRCPHHAIWCASSGLSNNTGSSFVISHRTNMNYNGTPAGVKIAPCGYAYQDKKFKNEIDGWFLNLCTFLVRPTFEQ